MSATHRHTTHEHEHEFESGPGLPEPLPADEKILWQGVPDWRVLARECFHIRKLAVYFGLLVALHVVNVATGDGTAFSAVVTSASAILVAALALAIVALLAWLSARTTVYTITDRRVVMRVGIVLSVTFNLPFSKVEAADMHRLPREHGDIALTLDDSTRIAYLHLWPHARPWRVARTQPSLRCIADAPAVARLLTDAWRVARGLEPVVATAAAAHVAPVPRTVPSMRPASVAEVARGAGSIGTATAA